MFVSPSGETQEADLHSKQIMHFIRPWFLLLLIPLIFLLWKLWHRARNNNPWLKICDPHLLPVLLQTRGSRSTHLPLILLGLAWLFAVLALSGPSWSQVMLPLYRSTAGNVIVLDMSPAMLSADIKPDRFTRAKYKTLDLLKAMRDGSVGLVVFSGEAYSVAPLTNDSNTLSNLAVTLDPSIMPVAGDNMAQGLQLAANLLQQAQAKPMSITLITGSLPDKNAFDMARKLAASGIKINVLGVGTSDGAPVALPQGGFVKDAQGNVSLNKLNVSALQQLAAAGNGDYISFSSSDSDIQQIIADLPIDTTLAKNATTTRVARWEDAGQWFILFAVICALFGFRRGWWEEV